MKAISHLSFFFRSREALIIGLVFSSNSFMFGNWVTRIPDIKLALGLTDATLGLALLGAPIGAMIIMPFSGWIIARFNVGKTTLLFALLQMLSPTILSLSTSLWTLMAGLFYFGFTNAIMDIAMNAAAASVEKKQKRPIMSTCHGMWSLGAMAGSAVGSVVLALHVEPGVHLMGLTLFLLAFIATIARYILMYREETNSEDKLFAIPNRTLLALAIMAFCILLSEGAIADWSALYMKESLIASPVLTGLAYAAFSGMMAIGRFMGDAIIPVIGKKKTALWGGLLSAISLAITLVLGDPYLAIIGFALTGLGYSCVVPVIFSSAANEPGFSAGAGIAAVSTVGYAGFLAGPPLIGLLSEQYSLPFGMGLIVILSFLVFILAMKIRFR
ncbi:MAG: MFS transporter [Cyclobacteriaceae bacterium]|nr:MFS transporter [Cyclobacteriaceae bacterium]